ncbi:MAG TPA: sigma 54-interacting transcriptional regulator [Terriglobia bacterium]|nr:sigma 54-interacting transcriptional regulator [Terriglobia bacterium]
MMETRAVEQAFRIDPLMPPAVDSVEKSGLDFGFLADMALKTVFSDTNCSTERVADKLKLPMAVVEPILQHLYREKLIDIRGSVGFENHKYSLLDRGWDRVQRMLEVNGYIGPAPVSLEAYTSMIQDQQALVPQVTPDMVRRALAHLILPESTVQTLGVVANSRRSILISGPAGTGKTTIAKALHSALGGEMWIPYAIEVDGQIIKVFDSHNHKPIDPQPPRRHDNRWVKIERPVIIVGGELTIEATDLTYSPGVRYYDAPFQMKSNCGTLVIDDFGRQRVDPHELLNRWIIPLEGRVDYLTLHTGKKIQVPFEQTLIIASNLEPKDLADPAFLRRMGYRLRVDLPSRDAYAQIFRAYLERKRLEYSPELVDVLFDLYDNTGTPLRSCEPRDLVERCLDICRYEGRPLSVTPALLHLAWKNYFGTH